MKYSHWQKKQRPKTIFSDFISTSALIMCRCCVCLFQLWEFTQQNLNEIDWLNDFTCEQLMPYDFDSTLAPRDNHFVREISYVRFVCVCACDFFSYSKEESIRIACRLLSFRLRFQSDKCFLRPSSISQCADASLKCISRAHWTVSLKCYYGLCDLGKWWRKKRLPLDMTASEAKHLAEHVKWL